MTSSWLRTSQRTASARFGAWVGHAVETHEEAPALGVGEEIGRKLKDLLEEAACFVSAVGEKRTDEVGELGFGAVGHHLDGVGDHFALLLEPDDILAADKLADRYPFG